MEREGKIGNSEA